MADTIISWYGHCAFLLGLGGKKLLLDPYDHYKGIDIGEIKADYLISSSIAHDHGNIAASVEAYTIGHEGEYDLPGDIKVQGILSSESRGTPNIIWNITYKDISITNFADWGEEKDIEDFTKEEKDLLASTTIAFVRPNEIPETDLQCAELALKVCEPNVIIPHHFFPESFVREYPTDEVLKMHAHYKPLVNLLISKLDYEVKEVNSYKTTIKPSDLKNKTILFFKKVQPDVLSID